MDSDQGWTEIINVKSCSGRFKGAGLQDLDVDQDSSFHRNHLFLAQDTADIHTYVVKPDGQVYRMGKKGRLYRVKSSTYLQVAEQEQDDTLLEDDDCHEDIYFECCSIYDDMY